MKKKSDAQRPRLWMRGGLLLICVAWWGLGWGQAPSISVSGGPFCPGDIITINVSLPMGHSICTITTCKFDGINAACTFSGQQASATIPSGLSNPTAQVLLEFERGSNCSPPNFSESCTTNIQISLPPNIQYPTSYCWSGNSSIVPSGFTPGSINFSIPSGFPSVHQSLGTIYGINHQQGFPNSILVHWEEIGGCGYNDDITIPAFQPTPLGINPYTNSAYCLPTNTQIIPNNTLPANGTFTASPTLTGLLTNGNITITTQAPAPGQYTIRYEPPSNLCKEATTQTITLENDQISATCPPLNWCEGSGFTNAVNINPTYMLGLQGSFSFSPTLGPGQFNSTFGQINTTQAPAGTYLISYQTSNNTCNRTFNNLCTIKIDTFPNAEFSYSPRTHCSDDPNSTPSAIVPNGKYYAPGLAIDSLTGSINWLNSTATSGPIVVQHRFPSAQCPSQDTFHLYRYFREIAGFHYGNNPNATSTTFCEGTTNIPIVLDSGFTHGGTFIAQTSTGTIQMDNMSGTIYSATPGQYLISYTSPGICPSSHSFSVNILQDPPLQISYDSLICVRNTTVAAPMGIPIVNGHFTSNDLAVDSITGEIDLQTNNPMGGPFTIYYVTDPPACPDTALDRVRLYEPDTADFHYGSSPTAAIDSFCSNLISCTPIPDSGYNTGGRFRILSPVGVDSLIDSITGVITFHDFVGVLEVVYETSPDLPCGSASDTDYVQILEAPQAYFNYSEAYYCQVPDTIIPAPIGSVSTSGTFTCSNNPNFIFVDNVQGTFNPAINSPGFDTIVHTVWIAGSHQCESSYEDVIEIKAIDTGTQLNISQNRYCAGDTFEVTVNGQPALPGGWIVSPNLISPIDENFSHYTGHYLGNLETTFHITYHGYGYCEEEDSVQVHIQQRDTTILSYPTSELGNDNYCTNDTAAMISPTYSDSGSFFYTIVGNGQLAIDPIEGTINLASSDQGVYTVHYRPSEFCRLDGLDTITIYQALDPNILLVEYSQSPDSLCEGDILALSAFNAPHKALFIEGDSIDADLPSFLLDSVWDNEGLMIRFRDNNGCYEDVHDTLHVYAYPTPLITPQDTQAYTTPDNIEVLMESMNPQTIFQWWLDISDPNVTLTSDSTGISVAHDSGSVYPQTPELELKPSSSVTHILYIIQPSSFGCVGEMDSVIFYLIPADDPAIFIPGAISPNGDNLNDVWKVTWDNETVEPKNYRIDLFNRSGAKVFDMSPIYDYWDGSNLPDGVYQYILTDVRDSKPKRYGGLTIRREPVARPN